MRHDEGYRTPNISYYFIFMWAHAQNVSSWFAFFPHTILAFSSLSLPPHVKPVGLPWHIFEKKRNKNGVNAHTRDRTEDEKGNRSFRRVLNRGTQHSESFSSRPTDRTNERLADSTESEIKKNKNGTRKTVLREMAHRRWWQRRRGRESCRFLFLHAQNMILMQIWCETTHFLFCLPNRASHWLSCLHWNTLFRQFFFIA